MIKQESHIEVLGALKLEGSAATIYVNVATILALFTVANIITRTFFSFDLFGAVAGLFNGGKSSGKL